MLRPEQGTSPWAGAEQIFALSHMGPAFAYSLVCPKVLNIWGNRNW